MDHQGRFDYHIHGSGNSDSVASATVTVQLSNSADALAFNFEVKNALGHYFALDYFPTMPPTGFVSADSISPNPVPAPPSFVLLGIGAVGHLGLSPWWRRKLAAA
jgi:hypothetical protein